MHADLDIYGLTDHRDLPTINRFIESYVDRAASEDRNDEELMKEPLRPDGKIGSGREFGLDADWEPAITLTHSISRGLDYPRRAFAIYLKAKDQRLNGALLCFTGDDKLILGLALEDSPARTDSVETATDLLKDLMSDFACTAGVIALNYAPPRWGQEFLSAAHDPHKLFFQGW